MKPDWNGVVTIFLGTLPVLGVIVWNLIEVKTLRERVDKLAEKLGELAERVSKIEGKIEGRHVVVES